MLAPSAQGAAPPYAAAAAAFAVCYSALPEAVPGAAAGLRALCEVLAGEAAAAAASGGEGQRAAPHLSPFPATLTEPALAERAAPLLHQIAWEADAGAQQQQLQQQQRSGDEQLLALLAPPLAASSTTLSLRGSSGAPLPSVWTPALLCALFASAGCTPECIVALHGVLAQGLAAPAPATAPPLPTRLALAAAAAALLASPSARALHAACAALPAAAGPLLPLCPLGFAWGGGTAAAAAGGSSSGSDGDGELEGACSGWGLMRVLLAQGAASGSAGAAATAAHLASLRAHTSFAARAAAVWGWVEGCVVEDLQR